MMLKDKVVVVSGIGPGLGQELAYGASREGARVVLAARSRDKLEEVRGKIEASGGDALCVPTDITDAEACRNLVERTVSHYGKLSVLINSAYTPGAFTTFIDADLREWRNTMETNFFGSMQLSQYAVGAMQEGGGGAIVMINSMVIKKPMLTHGGYAASKGAIAAATKILAAELGAAGIRVNSVCMGWMWGPPVESYVRMTAEQAGTTAQEVIDKVVSNIPIGRIPDDADCANAALFLASDLARVITGATLDVNGGEFMT